jgi:hypothetical protein
MRQVVRLGLYLAVLAGGLLLGVTAAGAQIRTQSSQTGEPAAIVTGYEMARNRGDIDAAMSYFADDATITQRNTTYSGTDEIRRYLEASTGRGRFVVVSNRRLNGVQLTWSERPAGQNVNGFEQTVAAIVQDGKIKAIVYNGSLPAARTEVSADGRSLMPALLGLAAVILVFSGAILVISTGLPHPRVPQSTLRGRLHQDLQVWRSARSASG